jgi:serine/threonine protein kinase
MRTNFIHHKHLCLVFECLSSNLYELIKQNSFRGLSTQLVKVFTTQLLDTLTVLHEQRLIHCDLKPENILLKRSVPILSPLSRPLPDPPCPSAVFLQPPISSYQSHRLWLGLPRVQHRLHVYPVPVLPLA